MKTTIKVDLPADSILPSACTTRITLPKKNAASLAPHSNKISISTQLSGESPEASPDTQASVKPLGVEETEAKMVGRPRKRRETVLDDEAREQLIYKILNESSKKLKKKAEEQAEFKREQRSALKPRPDPPCVKLISRPQGSYLLVPSAINIHQLLNCQSISRPQRTAEFCQCGREGKYRDPISLKTYCSVPCFQLLKKNRT